MKFTVERPTPGFSAHMYSRSRDSHRSEVGSLIRLLPITVEADPERRAGYPGECVCPVVYRLTSDSVRYLRKIGLLKPGLNVSRRPVVCSCMGNVS